MKSSNIMRGIVFTTLIRQCSRKSNYNNKIDPILEETRNRKKPAGGTRYLRDKNNIYLFNAWYLVLAF